MQLSRRRQGLLAVGRLGSHFDVVLAIEDRVKPGADKRLIIDDEDPDHAVSGSRACTA